MTVNLRVLAQNLCSQFETHDKAAGSYLIQNTESLLKFSKKCEGFFFVKSTVIMTLQLF